MIRLGGELAAALKTGLAVGRKHVSLVALDDASLTTPEAFLEALKRRFGPDRWAAWYDDDVRTGGHRLYFSNTHCRFWREVLPRLDTHKTQVLAEAVALFGEKGPSDELAARREQLLALTPEQQRALAALDQRYRG